jgi:hypothetical protein
MEDGVHNFPAALTSFVGRARAVGQHPHVTRRTL